ncbi:MAG: hypothetical protein HUU41_01945 [Bryobacteraceae bacterium]|nr:hypothetical protein [Bryobacterales bacterium]MEB2361115.1 hypothetical protein [Bryobacterales bacterium]NUM99851.1 hypothetical protein [Bryobacteraceae bacterium]
MASPAPARATSGASITLNLFDGTRRPLRTNAQVLVRIRDGNQNDIHSGFHKGRSLVFENLPFYNNFGDNYTVLVSIKGYFQAGFTPVQVAPNIPRVLDLMMIPKNGAFNFRNATWQRLKSTHPVLSALLAAGAETDTAARERYEDALENKAASLACFFNVVTAVRDIRLPSGTPLDYFRQIVWNDPRRAFAQDRFYAWVDETMVDQVVRAATQGIFQPEPGAGLFHPGATRSYKQVQFGEANVQLTFHENDRLRVKDTDCVLLEADIDYYKDPLAHALIEVLKNRTTKSKTDPRSVYVLRWMAGRHAGVPDFDPPYTIEA